MQAQCSPNKHCESFVEQRPHHWFEMGTVSYSTNYDQRYLIQNYYHYTNVDMSCLPCCHLGSKNYRMPGKTCIIIVYIRNSYSYWNFKVVLKYWVLATYVIGMKNMVVVEQIFELRFKVDFYFHIYGRCYCFKMIEWHIFTLKNAIINLSHCTLLDTYSNFNKLIM